MVEAVYRTLLICILPLFLLLGGMLGILLPPFQVPDEPAHWTTAYSRSESMLSGFRPSQDAGCNLANALPNNFDVGRIAWGLRERINPRSFSRLAKAELNCSPFAVGYGSWLTYPGILPARLLIRSENLSAERTLVVFYLTRFFHGFMIFFCLARVVYFALRTHAGIVPGLLSGLAFTLSPLFLQQSFSINADPVTFMATICLIQFFIFWRYCTSLDFIILAYSSFAVATTKPPLVPLIAITLIASYLRNQGWRKALSGSCRRGLILLSGIIGISIALAAWATFLNSSTTNSPVPGVDINSSRQIAFIFENPHTAFVALSSSLKRFLAFPEILRLSSLGAYVGPLGWLTATLSSSIEGTWKLIFYLLLSIDVLLTGVGVSRSFHSSRMRGLFRFEQLLGAVLILACHATGLFLAFTMYLFWSPVGGSEVLGLQARYFFPILLLAPLALGSIVTNQHSQIALSSPEGVVRPRLLAQTSQGIAGIIILTLGLVLGSQTAVELLTRYW